MEGEGEERMRCVFWCVLTFPVSCLADLSEARWIVCLSKCDEHLAKQNIEWREPVPSEYLKWWVLPAESQILRATEQRSIWKGAGCSDVMENGNGMH